MRRRSLLCLLVTACLMACGSPRGTDPPPGGWSNNAPTRVDQVVQRADTQVLAISQGEIKTWIEVPAVGAQVGEYVLLGQGTLQQDVRIPELDRNVRELVTIAHVQVVDLDTAQRAIRAASPADAVPIGTVYAELDARADTEIVVVGTVIKAPNAIGSYWVHLQDGSGDRATKTHDLTVKTQQAVTVGQRVAFRGILRKDVDLGFGYHYTALVEDGSLVH